MLKRDFLKIIGLGASGGLLGGTVLRPTATAGATTTLDEVLTRGTLRLGYTPYSIGFQLNPNTGTRSGIYVDIVTELCARLNLKPDWVAEVGWGTQIEGLKTKQYDMVGSPVSLTPSRARAADFSLPLYYSPVHVWSHRAGLQVDQLNRPDITVATLDGEQTDTFAQTYFPQAKRLSLPQSTSFAELLETVATGKADITFAEPLPVYDYNANRRGSGLINISAQRPLLMVPNILLLPQDQLGFKAMIDNALTDLHLSGYIGAVLDKWEKYPGSYIRATGQR